MSKLDLILKDISDIYVRENFFRIKKFFDPVPFLQGDFKFLEIEIKKRTDKFPVRHGFSFIPEDVFILSVIGNHNFYFIYDLFDKDSIYLHAEGPCVVRFLVGRLSDKSISYAQDKYPFVAPTGTTTVAPPVASTNTVATESPKLSETFATDVSTVIGALVKISATDTVTKITDNFSTTIPNGVFGVVWDKPTTTSAKVLFLGIMSGFSGFSPGAPLFVSISGVPTHAVPTTGMVQQIGFAISSTRFFLQLGQPLRRT